MKEFALLGHIFAANRDLPANVLVPPGDDMAMVRLAGRDVLVAVDQVVEGRHFRPETPVALVGRKAITRSLSDIAAMAGAPVATLVATTLPAGYGEARALALFEAMRRTAAEYGAPLIGGDLAIDAGPSARLVCSVTVMAEPTTPAPVTRGGARAGDAVYVSGALGGSSDGRHLTFEPRIEQAIQLARLLGSGLHAMLDISDGLGRDAGHIASMSNVRIEIEVDRIPCRAGADWRRAASEGEDYELCFAAAGPVPSAIAGLAITRVGRVMAPGREGPGVFMIDGPRVVRGDEMGWEHGGEGTKGRRHKGTKE